MVIYNIETSLDELKQIEKVLKEFYVGNNPKSSRHNSSFHSRSLAMKLFLCNFSVEGGELSGGALCESQHVPGRAPRARRPPAEYKLH